MRRIAVAFLIIAPINVLAFSISFGPNGDVIKWPPSIRTIPYWVNPNAPGVSPQATLASVQRCFNAWQNVGCSYLGFSYQGPTSGNNLIPVGHGANGYNELGWITNSYQWRFGQYVLGVTSPLFKMSGEIYEADIAFNGVHYTWNDRGQIGSGWSNEMDLDSVVLHEEGHFFGLQHVLNWQDYMNHYNDYPTMAPQVAPNGASGTLSEDDMKAICYLYPASGHYTCSTDWDCPYILATNYQTGKEYYAGRYVCRNGICVRTNLQFGDLCAHQTECAPGLLCRVVITSTTTGDVQMCTRECDPNNDDCPTGYHCDSGHRVCAPGQTKKKVGEPCSYSSECTTNFCMTGPDGNRTCRIRCDMKNPQCPPGQTCWAQFSTSSVGGCYGGVPPVKKEFGVPCDSGEECNSGYCWAPQGHPLCTQACNPSNPNSCPQGFQCLDAGGGQYLCGFQPLPDGETCVSDADCASGHCVKVPLEDRPHCRSLCNLTDWECQWGTYCVYYEPLGTDFGVCMPSLDKKKIGEPCNSSEECVSLLCYKPDMNSDQPGYCVENCVDGKCPEGMICGFEQEGLGHFCIYPPGTITNSQVSSGGGCSQGGPVSPWGMIPLLLLALGLLGLRRFSKTKGQVER